MVLTIAIPTFNRGELLKKQITRILSCISSEHSIEILISDNASDDDTYEIVQDAIKKNASFLISYYRNDVNLGFDLNVNNTMHKAKGDYVWILSDDDKFLDVAVPEIYGSVVKFHGEFSVGFINYKVVVGGKEHYSNSLVHSGDSFICDKEEFFIYTGLASSFISANIFRRNDWFDFDCSLYKNLLWVHLFAARNILSKSSSNKALVIPSPLIFQIQPEINQSRKESGLDKINDIDLYLAAHIYIGRFCEEVVDYGYSESLRSRLISHHKKDDVPQVITYKLSSYKKNMCANIRFLKLYFSLDRSGYDRVKVVFSMLCPSFLYVLARNAKNRIWKDCR